MGGRAVMRLMKGLADVFEGVGWEADLLLDLSKAWPTCLKGLHERLSCFGTCGGLRRRVLRLTEGFADVLKGLDRKPTCYETYARLGCRV